MNNICCFLFLAVGWTITALGLIQLPLWAVYAVIKQKGDSWSDKIRMAFRPTLNWGPTDPKTLEKYQMYTANWRDEINANPPTNLWQKFKQKVYG